MADVSRAVLEAIAEFNQVEGTNVPVSADTVLLGEGGALDSLGLVRLVMAVEQKLEDAVGALTEYAAALLSETK